MLHKVNDIITALGSRWKLVLAAALLVSLVPGCATLPQFKPGRVYYFQSWGRYSHPVLPHTEISLEEAQELRQFYEGRFGRRGKLVSLARIVDGVRDREYIYIYRDNGTIAQAEIHYSAVFVVTLFFDERGKRIVGIDPPNYSAPNYF